MSRESFRARSARVYRAAARMSNQYREVEPSGRTAIIHSMPPLLSAVSIVVPTFREAPNIKPLVERIFAAIAPTGRKAELILVDDDSQDGTEAIIEELSATHPIRLIVRREARGLSSAVLAGFQAAEHDLFVVMDADLQHPPEMIPTLIDRLERGGCDFAIGSRYA